MSIAVGITLILAIGALSSAALTFLALQYTQARDIIDHPNARSSHEKPTPRGGGIAIVLCFLIGVVVLQLLGAVPDRLGYALLGGGILVGGIGWLDDLTGVPVLIRVSVHIAAAIWAISWLGGAKDLWLLEHLHLGLLGSSLAVIGVAWWINLYNFMDGIDGIAAGHAVTVAGFAGVLLILQGDHTNAFVAILLAAVAFGFLFWNWPPARIFMGDVGSGFLGFVFAILAIASENAGSLPVVFWIILSGAFVFDATLTLLRRLWWRQPFWSAHRAHAYQRMVRIVAGHARVTNSVIALNIGLAAIVWFALHFPHWTRWAIVAALILLVSAYLWVERREPMRQHLTNYK